MSDLVIEKDKLQKMLQSFNGDLDVYINDDQRFKLGRVLTIIDAAIGDPEQRKAIKDLVNNEWWSQGNRPGEHRMTNPHTDLRGLCKALGFELYEESSMPLQAGNLEDFAASHYEKLVKE